MALSKHSLLNVVIFFRTGTMLGFPAICFSLLSLLHVVWGRVIYNGNDGNNEKQNTFFLLPCGTFLVYLLLLLIH